MKKKVLIIGYGITGKACVNYFLKKKYKVFVYDKNDQDIVGAKRVDCVEEVLQNGVRFAISSPSFNIKKDEFIKSLIRLGVDNACGAYPFACVFDSVSRTNYSTHFIYFWC